MRAEEQRQEARGKKPRKRKRPLRGGRITTAEKVAQAERTEKVFPAGVPKATAGCRTRGRCGGWRTAKRCWWPMKSIAARGINTARFPASSAAASLGWKSCWPSPIRCTSSGLSFDKVCLLMNFFQNLKLRKSQADALLNQLARHWEGEFDLLCTLLAQLAGGAYRRDGLEHRQRVGVSLREGAGAVLRRA